MRWVRSLWFLVGVAVAASVAPLVASARDDRTGARSSLGAASRSLLFVADFLSSSVTEYPVGITGNVAPIRTIGGSRTGLRHPFGIARDAGRNLYVVSSGYPPSISVFAARAGGNIAPFCTIAGSRTGFTQPLWIALDAADTIFVTDAGAPAQGVLASVRVFPAHACGNIAPVRVIAGPQTQLRVPGGITFDATGHIIVVSSDGMHNQSSAGLRFSHNATGNVTPQIFAGPNSGLALPFGISAVPASGAFLVANPGNASVTVYGPTSPAELTALRSISGAKTGFAIESVAGVTVDAGLNLYVSNRFANPVFDTIAIFAPSARANVAPAATIRGSRTQLFGPGGMLVAPE